MVSAPRRAARCIRLNMCLVSCGFLPGSSLREISPTNWSPMASSAYGQRRPGGWRMENTELTPLPCRDLLYDDCRDPRDGWEPRHTDARGRQRSGRVHPLISDVAT